MTKVEEVARAMREELGVDWPYTGHNDLLDVARAAMEAMREPTEAMEEAGRNANPRGPTVWPDYDAATIFTAMIDAALEEGK